MKKIKWRFNTTVLIIIGIFFLFDGRYGQNLYSAEDLSIDEKIGQMIAVGFQGMTVDKNSPVVRDIRKGRVGGIIVFDYDVAKQIRERNIKNPQQLKDLITSLKQYASTPLFVMVDQEGGAVARLNPREGFPPTYSSQRIAEGTDLKGAAGIYREMASTVRWVGINVNFAPVVDLNTNPSNPVIGKRERSFSGDPNIVVDYAREFIRAHRDQNILTSLKHFPGHGSSRYDTHETFVDISETWREEELIPYRVLIAEGLVDMVMTAHIFNKHLDPQRPATLSKKILRDLLRNRLGYSGVIVSDSLEMGAITQRYSFKESVLKSVGAGIDIMLFSNNKHYDPDLPQKIIRIVKDGIKNNRFSEERIDESYQRIMALKRKLGKGL